VSSASGQPPPLADEREVHPARNPSPSDSAGVDAEAIPLADGRLLARNGILNLAGLGLPLLVAIFAIPHLIHGLGTERFGILTLAWIAIGYFSVFDLGLGRALTQLVADRMAADRRQEIAPLVSTAQLLVLALGAFGGLVLAAITPWLVASILQIPESLQAEARATFYLLGFALPWVLGTIGWRGYLEAQQRFGIINAIRVPLGVLNYAGPLAVLPFSSSLVPIVAVLVGARVIGWVVHCAFSVTGPGHEEYRFRFSRAAVNPLIRIGSWMTVSNIISPIMVYLDRVLIGAMLSIAAVAYYVTPFEVVTRLWLVPSAFLAVAFPAFAATFGRNAAQWSALVDRSFRVIFLVVFPLSLVLVTLAHEGLQLWVGGEFASEGYAVLQWLAVGVFVNSLGQVAFAAIQGAGRPDITAKLHLAELPAYGLALWWLLQRFGIEGVAMAWTARVVVDTILLVLVCSRLSGAGGAIAWSFGRLVIPSLAVLGLGAYLPGTESRVILVGFGLCAFAVLSWRFVVTSEERLLIRTRVGSITRFQWAQRRL
jgi:O-antigen/teichoic acid export membrane protein